MGRLEQVIVGAAPRWLIDIASRARSGARNRLSERRFGPVVRQVLPDAISHELLVANDDAVVMRVAMADGSSSIMKLASSEIASAQGVVERAALDELAQHTTLGDWRDLLATVQSHGTFDGGTWFTQTMLAGVPTSTLSLPSDELVTAVAAALKPLHDATNATKLADDAVLDDLVSGPLDLIAQWRPALSKLLTEINGEYRRRLAGNELVLARSHGDYAPTNVLWDDTSNSVCGIVDWGLQATLLPPEIDYVHYGLSLLMLRNRQEYGTSVISLIGEAATTEADSCVHVANDLGPNGFDAETAAVLAWLQHIAFGLHKAHDLRTNPIWLGNNIDAVVRALQAG